LEFSNIVEIKLYSREVDIVAVVGRRAAAESIADEQETAPESMPLHC